MAIWNEEQWESFDDYFRNYVLAQSTGSDDMSQEHIDDIRQEALSIQRGDTYDENRAARQLSSTLMNESPDGEYVSQPYTYDSEVTPDVTGTTFAQSYLSDPKNALREMKDSTYRLTQMQSWDYAMQASGARAAHSGDPKMTIEEANQIAKEQGADVKFDHPVSNFEVQQSISAFKKREALQMTSAQASEYVDDSLGTNAAIIASGIMGGVGPVELASTVALSWAVPELGLAAVSKGASAAQNMLKVKRVTDATKAVRAAKNINTMVNAGKNAGETGHTMTVVGSVLRNTQAAQKFFKTEEAIIKADAALQKVAGISYQGLSGVEKTGLDTLTFLAADVPFIRGAYTNSQQMGFDLYDEKDKALDSLFALTLGVGVGAGFRATRHFFGITPSGLLLRRVNDMEVDIKTKAALGQITSEQRDVALKNINVIRKGIEEQGRYIKKPAPGIVQAADDIQRVNVSNETYIAQQATFLNELIAGNRPKLSMLPEFESRLSHIRADEIRHLLVEKFDKVFNTHIIRDVQDGKYATVKLAEETGLLGDAPVGGLSEKVVLEQIENMYKGMILKDEKALADFKMYSETFQDFSDTMSRILEDYQEKFEANKSAKARGEKPVYKKNQLTLLERDMKEAFFRLWFKGDKAGEDLVKKGRANYLLGKQGQRTIEYTLDELEAINAFTGWFDNFVKKDEKGFYDFVNPSGSKDGGATFRKYTNKLSELAEGNTKLAQADDQARLWSQEKVDNIIKSAQQFDVSTDTDYAHIFAEPRVTGKEYAEQVESKTFWDGRLSIQRLEHEALLQDKEYSQALDFLKRLSIVDPTIGSFYTRTLKKIDFIREVKQSGYEEIKSSVMQRLRDNETFQSVLRDIGNPALDWNASIRSLNIILRKAVTDELTGRGFSRELADIKGLVTDVADRFNKMIEEHPENLEMFLSSEELARSYKASYEAAWDKAMKGIKTTADIDEQAFKDAVAENVIEPVVRQNTVLNQLFDELTEALDISLSRLELQHIHDADIMVRSFDLMLKHPEDAGEVLMSLSTQSHGMHEGSGLSVEYMSKNAGFFLNDIKNTLFKEKSTNGKSLLETFMSTDKEVRDSIVESQIRRKYGESTKNADADRIAEVIDNDMKSFLASFRKLGSDFSGANFTIKRGALKYIDRYITDSIEADIATKLADSVPEALSNGISKIFRLNNDTYRKMAIWALRDFDLDIMFDRYHRQPVSLNAVRDALLAGDIDKFAMAKDPKHYEQVQKALDYITDKLIGKNPEEFEGKLLVKGGSWVYNFRAGFNDIGGIALGKKAAAIDAVQSNLVFKDADTEIAVAKVCGFDNIIEQTNAQFNSLVKAYYALNNYGTNPRDMVETLINTFNKARKSGEYAEFLNKRYMSSVKIGKKADVEDVIAKNVGERYAITENMKKEILDAADLACGLQSYAPSSITRVIKAITKLFSSGLLAGAGAKSIADWGTVMEGLVTNGIVTGKREAMRTMGDAMAFLWKPANRDIRNIVLATSILEHEDLLRRMTNDPSSDLVTMSKAMSGEDQLVNFSNKFADVIMNSFGRMEQITNSNKRIAGLCLQMGLGQNADLAFKELSDRAQFMLRRSGINEADWDFMRSILMHDMNEYINSVAGTNLSPAGSKLFIPLAVRDYDLSVFVNELRRRGYQNVNNQLAEEFRNEIACKAWGMIDAASDELVSIPSGRIQYYMRGGQARNSKIGMVAEIVTQFQSFPAALTYSTYGRRLQTFAANETGITALDILTGKGALRSSKQREIYGDLFLMLMSIALTTLVVDKAVDASRGRIQKPTKEAVLEDSFKAITGAMGVAGPIVNAFWDGVDNAGLRGGGLNIQVAPSISTAARSTYRLSRPLKKENVDNRWGAFSAGIANEAARYSGLKGLPIIAPVYQMLVGSWLDAVYEGSPETYTRKQDANRNRGKVIMPWETGQPLGGLLQ